MVPRVGARQRQSTTGLQHNRCRSSPFAGGGFESRSVVRMDGFGSFPCGHAAWTASAGPLAKAGGPRDVPRSLL